MGESKKKSVRDNEPLSSLTHLIATVLSVVGLVLMVVFAALKSDAKHVTVVSIFGGSMILLYLASTLFHFFKKNTVTKEVFLRIDHSMIYVLIAGTYTPICLLALKGWLGWTVFGVIWGLAVLGITLKAVFSNRLDKLSTVLYVLMGWVIVVAFMPLKNSLLPGALFWLVAGGVFYTVGALFYGMDNYFRRTRWFGMHEVFHVFVMLGSFSHFWVVFNYLI